MTQVPVLEHAHIPTNGIRLHVVQAGAGTPLFLLHGFPEFWYSWRNQITPLAQAGFRLWMPDQRGYNLSDKPHDIAAYSLDMLADDLIGLFDAAGVEKARVVGHDWGGGALWWALNKYPERFDRAVLLNIAHHAAFARLVRENAEQRRRSRYMMFFQTPVIPELLLRTGMLTRWAFGDNPNFTAEDRRKYQEAWRQSGAARGMLNWYRAIRVSPPKRLASPRIIPPVLLIWGMQDKAFLPEAAHRSMELCEDGRLEMLETASHWVQHDESEAVTRLIIDFMR